VFNYGAVLSHQFLIRMKILKLMYVSKVRIRISVSVAAKVRVAEYCGVSTVDCHFSNPRASLSSY
jgi:hypothetical protein